MSLLQHEIDAFTDSNPGIATERIRTDVIELELKDRGSFQAAQLAMSAFGGMMAVRAARRTYADALSRPATTPLYDYLLGQELKRANTILELLEAGHEDSLNRGSQNMIISMPEANAEFLLDTMAETGRLAARTGDLFSYYADLMPHLLNEAGLSVDGNQYRYSI
jgi:hypothetical protein